MAYGLLEMRRDGMKECGDDISKGNRVKGKGDLNINTLCQSAPTLHAISACLIFGSVNQHL
jgi:hypothetical protein